MEKFQFGQRKNLQIPFTPRAEKLTVDLLRERRSLLWILSPMAEKLSKAFFYITAAAILRWKGTQIMAFQNI